MPQMNCAIGIVRPETDFINTELKRGVNGRLM